MFFCNNTIKINLERPADGQNIAADQENHVELNHSKKTCASQFTRTLLILALLGAGVVATQAISPAYAADDNTDAAAKVLKQRSMSANPNANSSGGKTDTKAADHGKANYEKRLNSVNALMKALKRESEKAGVNNSTVLNEVESNMKKATLLAKQGSYGSALETVDQGYKTLTAELSKLENQKSQSGSPDATTAKPEANTSDSHESIDREFRTNKALLDVLKRQNEEKYAGKEGEIVAIETTITDARNALNAGDIAFARELVGDANARTKRAIASLQSNASTKPDGAAAATTHQEESATAAESNLKKDYTKRKNTVIALLDSAKRIDVERGTAHPAFAKTEAMIDEADKLAAAGNVAEGKAQLDRAYLMLKEAMREMLNRKKGSK